MHEAWGDDLTAGCCASSPSLTMHPASDRKAPGHGFQQAIPGTIARGTGRQVTLRSTNGDTARVGHLPRALATHLVR